MFILAFILLLAAWTLLSGKFDAMHLGMGVFSAFFVAYITRDIFFQDSKRSAARRAVEAVKVIGYSVRLIWDVVLANFYVLYIALHPRMEELIDPQFVSIKTSLKDPFSRYLLATSITLTPGTVTLVLEDDELLVHALDGKSAQGLPDTFDKRIAAVFDQTS